MFKDKKEKLETEHEEREKLFLEKLNENHESSLSRLSDAHQEKIALMERQYLQQKQQVIYVKVKKPVKFKCRNELKINNTYNDMNTMLNVFNSRKNIIYTISNSKSYNK